MLQAPPWPQKGLPLYYFAERHFFFAALGIVVMLGASTLQPATLRRLSLAILLVALGLMVWTIVGGPEIKGARRWVHLAGHSLQPSEIGKPALIVLVAWLFSERTKRSDVPAIPIAITLAVLFCGLLVVQPDVGQTILVATVWGALFVLSGQPLRYAAWFLPFGMVSFAGAWFAFPHVRSRVERFLDPFGRHLQTDRAIQSFAEGGLFGRGPGEGTIKTSFARCPHRFHVCRHWRGIRRCGMPCPARVTGVLAGRALRFAWHEPDAFARLAVIGLALLIVLQAAINMGVNVGLLPPRV
ncbi:MAG: FtsW/RodA/SpoVE family cell cycle protein [Hyphomicrobiaceae bacterium]